MVINSIYNVLTQVLLSRSYSPSIMVKKAPKPPRPPKPNKTNDKKKKKKNDKNVELVMVNGKAKEADLDDDESEQPLKTTVEGTKQEQLCAAAYMGDKETAIKLLDKGVDINCADEYGKTPLHHATTGKRIEFVEFLLSRGAELTKQDQRGDTPLHAAVRTGDEAIVKTLVSNEKCNVNAKGRGLCTPLHIACGMDKLKICKLLIEHEARIDLKDEDKMTPLGHAVEKGAKNTAEYIFSIGKSTNMARDTLSTALGRHYRLQTVRRVHFDKAPRLFEQCRRRSGT
ncbi:ankyrin repeat-containing protein DDB_G0279043-like [Nematostella vectensis]|uniref:ankyrin repeat-containing protein DDB_G0279043-like n=1 Tax=Nematostella vectensis TaxID=45351 RepID=UPI00207727DA|nr:ankyrin repeat-containing protein DDB_G0279043-like [Nematostella vectensis]